MNFKEKSCLDCQISIIIPVYNGEKTLKACLESIFACKEIIYEVILIDDGSNDNTLSIAEKYPCKIIKLDKNMGRSFARNRGMEASSSNYILFTDSDCIVCDNWINIALNTFKEQQKKDNLLSAMEGRILPLKGFINKCDAFAGYGYNQNLKGRYHMHFCTANLIADKEKIIEAGCFNEDIRDIEDQDLGYRLLEKGYQLFYEPSFSVIHNHTRNSFRYFLKHYYDWGKSLGNFFDIRYKNLRKVPFSYFLNNIAFYFLMIPVFSFFISAKIIWINYSYDWSVIFLFPFIFLSKIAYRIGALEFMKNKNINKLLKKQKESS